MPSSPFARIVARSATLTVALTAGLVACSGSDSSSDGATKDAGAMDSAQQSDAVSNPDAGSGGTSADASGGDASGEADAAPEPNLPIAEFSDEVWTWDQTVDACSYSNNGNIFWDWLLEGREPVADGKYPVFMYLHGTGDVADNPVAISIVESMAARGFVAGSVPYDSLGGIAAGLSDPTAVCTPLKKKAQCAFGGGEGSAITKLCARAKADCSRGIVLAGHSQGSWLAIAANDYDSRVRAVWGLGAGIHGHLTIDIGGPVELKSDLSSCLLPANRTLPEDRLRVVNGESEYVYGTSLEQDVRDLTNQECPTGTLECLRTNGSGWSFFPDVANEDGRGSSEHCYMANMPGGDCTESTGLNSNWTDGTASYAREPNLTWLRTFTD